MEAQYIQECICGAVTVTFDNGATNSMSRKIIITRDNFSYHK